MAYLGHMQETYRTLAQLLRVKPAVLLEMEERMDALSGQVGVLEDVVRQNEIIAQNTMDGLGVLASDGPDAIRSALVDRLRVVDSNLYEMLGKPDLQAMHGVCTRLCETVTQVFTPPKGLFLKESVARAMLNRYPPHNVVEHFGYRTVDELFDKEGFASVMASLRFTQTAQWMHEFFDAAYSNLTPDDFEERDVVLQILDPKWLVVAEQFMKKKYHNVSHLKEFGIIFVIPIHIDAPGQMMRLFTLLLHYLHEVPFYSGLFRQYRDAPDFSSRFRSLLRGDVPGRVITQPDTGMTWRIVQRYLAKDNKDDFRLFEPHVNPEADHWWRAEEDLKRLSRIMPSEKGQLDVGWWAGLDCVGHIATDPRTGKTELVSFDLIDLIMSLVDGGDSKHIYHQQEALWNKIFIEYMGRERMQELIAANIIDGFIDLT